MRLILLVTFLLITITATASAQCGGVEEPTCEPTATPTETATPTITLTPTITPTATLDVLVYSTVIAPGAEATEEGQPVVFSYSMTAGDAINSLLLVAVFIMLVALLLVTLWKGRG